MKAEERHRLHENELQRLTEHARERTRPFFEQYGTTLLLALAAVLIVVAVVVWFVRRGDAGRGTGWAELDSAFRDPNATAEDFANVAEVAKGSPAAIWAKLFEGEAHLSSGIESLFTDKEGATRDLADAQSAFEAVLAEKEAAPELTVRALYGLARALETTSNGDLKPALDRYEQITADYGDTVFAKLAQERMDALKSADSKAFYAWFSKQKPAPKDPIQRPSDTGPLGGLGLPGGTSAAPTDGPALGGATATEAAAGTGDAPAGSSTETESNGAPADSTATPEATPETATPAEGSTESPTGAAETSPQ